MNGLELLKEHPKAALVIKQFYLDKMLEGLKDESLPEDFKDLVRQQGIDVEKIAVFIDSSPRNLFDVFDNHKIYISVTKLDDGFHWNINDSDADKCYPVRIDAEKDALIGAFKLLNDKL